MKIGTGPEKLAVTINQAAEATGLSRRTIYNLMDGRVKGCEGLRSIKVGKRRLVVWESLERLVSGRQQ